MKHLYRLLAGLLLLNASPALAQTTDSLRTAIDRIFAPLDKTQVPISPSTPTPPAPSR